MTNKVFFAEPINTIERAKEAYINCGCTQYHMWHDYPERYEEYRNLHISVETELLWAKEAFVNNCKTLTKATEIIVNMDNMVGLHMEQWLIEQCN